MIASSARGFVYLSTDKVVHRIQFEDDNHLIAEVEKDVVELKGLDGEWFSIKKADGRILVNLDIPDPFVTLVDISGDIERVLGSDYASIILDVVNVEGFIEVITPYIVFTFCYDRHQKKLKYFSSFGFDSPIRIHSSISFHTLVCLQDNRSYIIDVVDNNRCLIDLSRGDLYSLGENNTYEQKYVTTDLISNITSVINGNNNSYHIVMIKDKLYTIFIDYDQSPNALILKAISNNGLALINVSVNSEHVYMVTENGECWTHPCDMEEPRAGQLFLGQRILVDQYTMRTFSCGRYAIAQCVSGYYLLDHKNRPRTITGLDGETVAKMIDGLDGETVAKMIDGLMVVTVEGAIYGIDPTSGASKRQVHLDPHPVYVPLSMPPKSARSVV